MLTAVLTIIYLIQDGFTPLHHVAKDGNMDMANILLKENANLFIHTNVG